MGESSWGHFVPLINLVQFFSFLSLIHLIFFFRILQTNVPSECLTLLSLLYTANAVLEGACERVIVGDLYCDIPLGLYVIRGENVVLIGELV